MHEFDPNKLQQFGGGAEKRVYLHPEDESKLVAIKKYREPISSLKGRFYLTKILHMLFPNNVPDIHFVGDRGKQTLVVEKKKLDRGHDEVRKDAIGYWDRGTLNSDMWKKHEATIKGDKRYKKLVNELRGLVAIDDAAVNFGLDDAGNLIYVESFNPSDRFNRAGMLRAIKSFPPDQRRTALSYLERLEKLCGDKTPNGQNKSDVADNPS